MAARKRKQPEQPEEGPAGTGLSDESPGGQGVSPGLVIWPVFGLLGLIALAVFVATFFVGPILPLLIVLRAFSVLVTVAVFLLPVGVWLVGGPDAWKVALKRWWLFVFAATMLWSIGVREGVPWMNARVEQVVCPAGYATLGQPYAPEMHGVLDFLFSAGSFPYCTGPLGAYQPRAYTYFLFVTALYLGLVLIWFAVEAGVARLQQRFGPVWLRLGLTPVLFVAVMAGLHAAPLGWAVRPMRNVFADGGSRPTVLHDAIERGDLAALRARLADGERVDGFYLAGHPPLYLALAKGSEDAARLLLDHGASVTIRDHRGRTALDYAARGSGVEMARAVLERGGDANAVSPNGETALYRAAKAERWDVVDLLLEHGADPAAGDPQRYPLMVAVATEDAPRETTARLLERGAPTEGADSHDRTPLLIAAAKRHWDTVVLLAEHGAAIDAKDDSGRTALHHAARISHLAPNDVQGRHAAMEALLTHGADANARDREGTTPLVLAVKRMVKWLNLWTGNDWYQKHPADLQPDLALVRLLVQHGADPAPQATRRSRVLPADYVRQVMRQPVRRALARALAGK